LLVQVKIQKERVIGKTKTTESSDPVLDRIFNSCSDYCLLLNHQQDIFRANPSFLQAFHLDFSDVKGMSVLFLFELLEHQLTQVISLAELQTDGYRFNSESKEGYQLSWEIHAIPQGDKSVVYLLIGKYALYPQLLNNYLQLMTMIEHMPCNVYWMDKNLKHIGCNQNILKMINVSKEQYIGSTYDDLSKWGKWPEGLADSFKGDDLEVLRTGKPKLNVEEPGFINLYGRMVYHLTSRVPLFDTSGRVVGVAGISTDITSIKDALQSAEASRQRQADFIANMSHDIKTPITGIIGLLREMHRESVSASQKRLIESIVDTTSELLSLLNDGIEAIQIRSGKLRLSNAPFNFRQLIEKNERLVRPGVLLKNLSIDCDYPKTVPDCFVADENFLNRILVNLLGNAVKFTVAGRISIKVRAKELTKETYLLEIAVSDTGIGIPDDKKEAIFEEFTRLNPSHLGKYDGHGLGLYTVKNYLQEIGGTITVDSQLGMGSTFTVTVPVGHSEDQSIQSEKVDFLSDEKISEEWSGGKLSVLLVEDNPMAANMAQGLLLKLGAQVVCAKNGEKAIAAVKAHSFDLIFMDIGLPDMDGLEATRQIRAYTQSKQPNLCIMGLSGHADKTHKQLCIDAGMDDMMSKPLLPKDAKVTLEKIFRSKDRANTRSV
jgi:two-component system aerobic respiration control sensor histidine kinase ArcB